MFVRLVGLALLSLTGCNTLLPSTLLPAHEEDEGLWGVGSCESGVCIRSLRANVLDTPTGQMLEFNSAVLSWNESPRYETSYDAHAYKSKPAIWIGRETSPLLGLGEGSELTVTIDGEAYTASSGYVWLMGSVLDSRARLRSLGLDPTEVKRESGEFGLYVFDLAFAERMMSATSAEFEIRGLGGTTSGTIDGTRMDRVQRHLRSWHQHLRDNR